MLAHLLIGQPEVLCHLLGRSFEEHSVHLLADRARGDPRRRTVNILHQSRAPEEAVGQNIHELSVHLAVAEECNQLGVHAALGLGRQLRGCSSGRGLLGVKAIGTNGHLKRSLERLGRKDLALLLLGLLRRCLTRSLSLGSSSRGCSLIGLKLLGSRLDNGHNGSRLAFVCGKERSDTHDELIAHGRLLVAHVPGGWELHLAQIAERHVERPQQRHCHVVVADG
mmetsp:Transcript_63660/g.93248  ORF Transcript_63660/g.93248 Transcript_63660/m.93248 type:complete len:224 (-) Transcript_63660:703-1374(-)